MRRSRTLLVTLICLSISSVAAGDPTATVTYDGVNASGNHTWTAWVSPDPELFIDTSSGFGGVLAVELAYAVEGSEFVSVEWEEGIWEYENPGWNPFIPGTPPESVTFGTWISPDSTRVFGAFGGPVFHDAGPFQLLYFETLGSDPTTIKFGQAASGDPVHGATLAQIGITTVSSAQLVEPLTSYALGAALSPVLAPDPEPIYFYGISGSVSSQVPSPSSVLLMAIGIGPILLRRRG